MLSSSSGKVRWQKYPYHVTVNATLDFSKVTCDTPFEGISLLIKENIPIMTTIVIQGMGSVQANTIKNVETEDIAFTFTLVNIADGTVIGRSLFYNMDGIFS